MEYRPLARTGVQVSPLCLGAMNFGSWSNPDADECVRIIHAALDAGVNFVDTADVYSHGESEEIVGRALRDRRDRVVLATKLHAPMGDDPNMRGNSRRWILTEAENSLRRLGTDHIDLYQVHRPDPDVDIEETLSALTDLVRSGKVRYLGCSTYPGALIVESQWAAERRSLERFVCEQPPYSILNRAVEREVLPVCERYGMGTIVWSPLAGGWLTGKYRAGQPLPEDSRGARMRDRFDTERPENRIRLEVVERCAPLAEQCDVTLSQLAVAWTLEHPAVTAAIIGPRTMDQLHDQLGAANVRLPAEVLDRIDELVPPGTNVDAGDTGWSPPWLNTDRRRRSNHA